MYNWHYPLDTQSKINYLRFEKEILFFPSLTNHLNLKVFRLMSLSYLWISLHLQMAWLLRIKVSRFCSRPFSHCYDSIFTILIRWEYKCCTMFVMLIYHGESSLSRNIDILSFPWTWIVDTSSRCSTTSTTRFCFNFHSKVFMAYILFPYFVSIFTQYTMIFS